MPATTRREYKGAAVATTVTASIADGSVNTWSITDNTGWPDGTTGKFMVEVDYDLSTVEKCLVTSRSGSTLNGITRGQDGTTAQGHTGANPRIRHVFSSSDIDAVNKHAADTAQGLLDHPSHLVAATHDLSGRHLPNVAIPVAAPVASAPGDTVDIGSGTAYSLATHRHAREAAASSFGAWASYPTTWAASGSPPSIGNGTLTSRYLKVGNVCWIYISLLSGSSTNYGVGNWSFTMPSGVASVNFHLLNAQFVTAFANKVYNGVARTTLGFLTPIYFPDDSPIDVTCEPVSGLYPEAWGSGNSLVISGSFECA